MSDMEKHYVKTAGDKLDEWGKQLTARFAVDPATAIKDLHAHRYTVHDARRKVEPRDFATKVIRSAKAVRIPSVFNQLMVLYNAFDVDLRRDLTRPTENTTVESFLQDLDNKKLIWWEMYGRNNRNTYNLG